MKGTVSPELRAILCDPDMRRRFLDSYFDLTGSGAAKIDLGNGQTVTITRFPVIRPLLTKRKRNLLHILLGK